LLSSAVVGKLPDFLIIGAAKAGTSFLFELIAKHPDVRVKRTPGKDPMKDKEKHYFDTARYQRRGLQWYKDQFPGSGLTGEATPYYLYCPRVAARVAATLPAVRLIVVLRDPVARAYSEYRNRVRLGMEDLSFGAALRAEPGRIAGERDRMLADETYYSTLLRTRSYRTRGVYVDQIREWHDHFPAEQMLILDSNSLFSEPRKVAAETFAFLGLEAREIEVPPPQNSGDGGRMPPLARWRLRRFYRPHNKRLYDYLGRDLSF
jgi:hypothetical protein